MKFQLPDKAVMDPLVLYRLLSHDTYKFFFLNLYLVKEKLSLG